MNSIPVLAYHRVAPGETMTPARFEEHLGALRSSGLPSLLPDELAGARTGFLLTFDDGFADLWTTGLDMLRRHGQRAAVFVIPGRTGEGPLREAGSRPFEGDATAAHAEAARNGGPHEAFLRWSELEALEGSGLVRVESHTMSHAMGWTGDRIAGFHLPPERPAHWSLSQCTGGDVRPGVPLYARGSALAHRLYFDDPGLRDRLAGWLERRGGAAYVRERGAAAVAVELEREAGRGGASSGGRWESAAERRRRTVGEIDGARRLLEGRLGGKREHLCLPWGAWDDETLAAAREAGIRRVYTLKRGANPAGGIAFLVRRLEPRPCGARYLRSRLWIYRSVLRSRLYTALGGRR